MESRKRVGSCLGILTALIVFLFSHSLMGQAVNGTLLGTVTDTSGATVAGAKVLATAAETGAVHESVSNESGNYVFPGPPTRKLCDQC